MPTSTATVQVIAWRSPSVAARRAASCSATIIHTPPRISAQAIGLIRSGSSQPNAFTSSPPTAVTPKAAASL